MFFLKDMSFHPLEGGVGYHGLSTHLSQGKITVLMGPSGIGKTTLFECLMGFKKEHFKALKGTIVFENQILSLKEWANKERLFFFVPDNPTFIPWLTCLDNILFLNEGVDFYEKKECLQALGLQKVLTEYPYEVSRGTKQRVALASALLSSKKYILLDEPLAHLDKKTKEGIYNYLKGCVQKLGLCLFLITHTLEDALALGDEILVVQNNKEVKVFLPSDPHLEERIVKALYS
jgi:NitT/TauT family transport system ATP-binding protein